MVEVVGIKSRDPSREKERVLSELIPTRVVESIPQFQQSIYVHHLSFLWRIVSFLFSIYFCVYKILSYYRCYKQRSLQPISPIGVCISSTQSPYEFSGNPTALSVYFLYTRRPGVEQKPNREKSSIEING